MTSNSSPSRDWINAEVWLNRSRWFAFAFIAVLPVLIYALLNAQLGAAEVYKWLPANNRDKAAYLRFLESFGNDQVMMVCWEGMRLDDPRIDSFILAVQENQRALGSDSPFERIETSRDVLSRLSSPPLDLKLSVLKRRFEGDLIGPQGENAIWVYFSDIAIRSPELAVQAIRESVSKVDRLRTTEVKLVGALFESYCIDKSVEMATLRFVPLSSLCAMLVAWLLLKNIPDTLIALSLSGIGQLIPIAVVYYAGDRFSAVQTMLPTLVFVLTLSGLIHLIKYAKHANSDDVRHQGVAAVMVGAKPCLWSSGTTILAMLSLAFSELAPIRAFGYYSALSLGLSTIVSLALFPAVYEWLTRFRRRSRIPSGKEVRHSNQFAARFVSILSMFRTPILVTSVACVVASGFALERLRVGTTFSSMYPADHPIIADVRWVEENIGNIVPVEVIITIQQSEKLSIVQQLMLIEAVGDRLKSIPEIGAVSSIVSYLPEIPTSTSVGAAARRAVMNRKLREAFDSHLNDPSFKNPMLAIGKDAIEWRLMARVSAFSDNFGATIEQVKLVVAEFERELETKGISHQIETTGVMQLAYASQTIMGKDFLGGMSGAMILLTLLMMWHAKSFLIGLCYMLPNILPVTLTLGAMAWLGKPVDMGGVLCSTIALGIAVDDTLHLTTYFQNLKKSGLGSFQSTVESLNACGPAMAITTATTCVSFAPFLFADFTPIQQFAWVCSVMLVIAWLGDMLLLTPLLARIRN